MECRKHGVRIVYKSLPDSDPITEMLLKSILQAMDEWHSMTSKVKGLAGMAENVRQGWRAGGRAPMGYKLKYHDTGVVREGASVMKSTLVVDAKASIVGAFLKARASGVGRAQAMRQSGLDIPDTTAIGIEWNALTYAGHTVWNQRSEFTSSGYLGKVKRRPRSEWKIHENTHDALITTDEAEILISALENTSKKNSRRTPATYLLSGIMVSPTGVAWHGDGEGFYRLQKGKRVKSVDVEQAVLRQIRFDLKGTEFVSAFTKAVHEQVEPDRKTAELARLNKEATEIERQIKRLTELLGQTSTPDPLLRQIETHEKRRMQLVENIDTLAEIERDADKVRNITEDQVARVMRGLAEDMQCLDRDALKDFVRGLLKKIELDRAYASAQLTYRLNAGDRLASPRGFEPRFTP